jgi:hypothetical protein
MRQEREKKIRSLSWRIAAENFVSRVDAEVLLTEVYTLTAERDEAEKGEAGARRLMDQTAERLFEELGKLILSEKLLRAERDEARREAVTARLEGFEAGRRKKTDDLGDEEVDAFPTFVEYEKHLAEDRADHAREVRIAEGEDAEAGDS